MIRRRALLAAREMAFLLFLAGISVLVTGMGVLWGNQSIQVALIHRINEPSLYPDDPFAGTLPRYAALLWWGVAGVARLCSLEPLLAALFLLQRVLLLFAARHLARALSPECPAAHVAAMVLFALGADVPRPGAGTLVSQYFEQTGLAIALIMLAAASVWSGRRWRAALWFAAGFTANPLYGLFAVGFLGPMAVLRTRRTIGIAGWFAPLALAAALILPAAFFSWQVMDWSNTPKQVWMETAQVWLHYHLFPSMWPRTTILRLALACAALLVVNHLIFRNRQEMKWLAIAWCLAGGFWLGFAWLAESAASPAMLLFQAGRASDLWYALGGVLLCVALAESAERARSPQGHMLGAAALLGGIALWQRALSGYLLAVAALTIVPIPILHHWRGSLRRAPLSSLLVLVALFPAIAAVADPARRILLGPPAAERLVAAWASAHSPRAATFLVPPEWEGFRALSRRPVFVVWKDVSATLWSPSYVNAWQDRMDALGLRVEPGRDLIHHARARLGAAFDRLEDDDVVRLHERFGVDYWVVPEAHPTSFPEATRVSGFRIVEVR